MILTMRQISNQKMDNGCMHAPTISITSYVLHFLGYDDNVK